MLLFVCNITSPTGRFILHLHTNDIVLHSRRQKELESSAPRGENNVKMKALQETILRMNEKNLRLTTENKTLKLDLEKVLEDSAKAKDNQS